MNIWGHVASSIECENKYCYKARKKPITAATLEGVLLDGMRPRAVGGENKRFSGIAQRERHTVSRQWGP